MKKSDNWEAERDAEFELKALRSYIFQYYDLDEKWYYQYYSWFDDEGNHQVRDSEYFERELYPVINDEPVPSGWLSKRERLNLLQKYFYEPLGTDIRSLNKWIILPNTIHSKILAHIERFGLLEYTDFLFEVIAIAQNHLIDKVHFWERPENQILIKSAGKAARDLKRVFDKNEASWAPGKVGKKSPAPLSQIIFVYPDETIKINHEWLIMDIVKAAKSSLRDIDAGDMSYSESFAEYPYKNAFKYKLAKSFSDFLIGIGAFEVIDDQPTPNQLMICIAGLLEFCLISVGMPEEVDQVKGKRIRLWISRLPKN